MSSENIPMEDIYQACIEGYHLGYHGITTSNPNSKDHNYLQWEAWDYGYKQGWSDRNTTESEVKAIAQATRCAVYLKKNTGELSMLRVMENSQENK